MKTAAKILFYILFLGMGVFLALNWPLFVENINPLLYQRGPAMSASLTDFSGSMNEADVRRVVAFPLDCTSDPAVLMLGDRVCYSNISAYAGMSALRVAFFFKDRNLANIKIDLPWWQHRKMGRQLIAEYGQPDGGQDIPAQGVRLVGWKLEQGNVLYNRDADRNPLMWNTVHWISLKESEKIGGVFAPR